MCKSNCHDGEKPFTRPEKPFLIIYADADDVLSFAWLEDEEEALEVIEEVKGYNCSIVDAIEIGTCRELLNER